LRRTPWPIRRCSTQGFFPSPVINLRYALYSTNNKTLIHCQCNLVDTIFHHHVTQYGWVFFFFYYYYYIKISNQPRLRIRVRIIHVHLYGAVEYNEKIWNTTILDCTTAFVTALLTVRNFLSNTISLTVTHSVKR
jgi:hypothetical protein